MLHIWSAVEADFERDYGINLMEQIDTMSWRRFLVLLNNLNPHGAVAAVIQSQTDTDNIENRTEAEEEKAASDFFTSMMGV